MPYLRHRRISVLRVTADLSPVVSPVRSKEGMQQYRASVRRISVLAALVLIAATVVAGTLVFIIMQR